MDYEEIDWMLVISAVLLIIINIIGWGISIKYSYKYNEYKEICDNYVEENLSEDSLDNLILELESAPKVLMAAVKLFVSNLVLNIIIDALFVIKLVYEIKRDQFLEKMVTSKINAICFLLIVIVTFFSIKSYFDEVQDYCALIDALDSVLNKVMVRMNEILG